MAINTKTIRDAIATRIKQRLSLECEPFDVPSEIYPRAVVLHGQPFIEYHGTFGRGIATLNFEIEVRTNAADDVSAQIALAKFVDDGTGQASSIVAALEDPTPDLGGIVENLHVIDVQMAPGQPLPNGGVEYIALFRVAVKARRD